MLHDHQEHSPNGLFDSPYHQESYHRTEVKPAHGWNETPKGSQQWLRDVNQETHHRMVVTDTQPGQERSDDNRKGIRREQQFQQRPEDPRHLNLPIFQPETISALSLLCNTYQHVELRAHLDTDCPEAS